MSNFKIIEQKFDELLRMAAGQFTSSELGEVREFLRVGEYGLALKTFSDIVVEERKQIGEGTFNKCSEIAEQMKMPAHVYEKMRKFTG